MIDCQQVYQVVPQIHQVGVQIYQVGYKNPHKIVPGASLGGLLGAKILIKLVLGPSWRDLGVILAPRGPQEGPKSQQELQKCLRGPLLAPKLGAMLGYVGLCWQLFAASWRSEGHLTQQEAEDGQSSPKMPQHSPQVHDFRAMLAGLSVPNTVKTMVF